MKLFDCFTFYNELDLLEIRFNELYDAVDYFILSESTIKHSGDPKPLYYKENKERYLKWADKIIHIIVDDAPPPTVSLKPFYGLDARLGLGRWRTERYQRNALSKGLDGCSSIDDIIFVSDIDEIPNKDKFDEIINLINNHGYACFIQKLYLYYLNGYVSNDWRGTIGCNFQSFKSMFNNKADNLRRLDNYKIRVLNRINIKSHPFVKDGGWHFSYLGGIEKVLDKMESTPHLEHINNSKNIDQILSIINNGKDIYGRENMKISFIDIDNSYPRSIIDNIKKYKTLIR